MTLPETARDLLWRHNLPEDVIDGALALHAQELAAVQRKAIAETDDPVFYEGEAGWLVNLIEPDTTAPAVSAVVPSAVDRADLRDRIAEAIHADLLATAYRRDQGLLGIVPRLTDAVLAVLPSCPDPIECGHEAALGEAQQQVRRLGLMVDEYGAGASALTDKLQRVRDLHRETCIAARGQVPPTAFKCGLCEVLDAPATEVRRMAAETPQQPEAERCANCGKHVRRISGTLATWWVHDPAGHTACFPQHAATSQRATPAVVAQPAKEADRG